jgi:tetratricopeptide (TPR) repeat protein
MKRLFGAVLLFVVFCAVRVEADHFTDGNAQYAAGRFNEAAEAYERAVAAGETNSALFYNLGNAHYRLGGFGRAILNYERALALEPRHPEATANLRLARDKARALEMRKRWWEDIASRATVTHYVVTAAISFWVAAFAGAVLFLARRRSASAIAVCAFGVLVCALASFCAYALETGARGASLAIVTGNKVDARLATADNANTVLTLPAGSQINILSTRGDWIYAALPNDLRGWIPGQAAERVRL